MGLQKEKIWINKTKEEEKNQRIDKVTLYWLLITEIIVECLVLMLEPASTMIEKKLAKKLKVFRMTDVHIMYTTSSFKDLLCFCNTSLSYFNFVFYLSG